MNVHLNAPISADKLLGAKLLAKYTDLHRQGMYEDAENYLQKAVTVCKYPPAIRCASWLILQGRGHQPPDRDMAINGFRMAARLGDPVSFLLYSVLTFSTSASYPHRGRLPTARRIVAGSKE